MKTMKPNDKVEILVVEDDARDLELTLYALASERISSHVQAARDGEEALDFLFCRNQYSGRDPSCHPKLILLDLKLPKVDGLLVLRQIKANAQTRALPVVILTSSRQEQDLVQGYQTGVNSYIQKPVDFDEFRETIRQVGSYWLSLNQPPPPEAVALRQPPMPS
jgi:two-component system, response regulator